MPLNFRTDIAPILTRAGCNGGGCHGKTDGRGSFQLSLFGLNPASDGNVVEPCVSYLRRKVDQGEPRLIHTIRGVGYVLRIPPP